MKQACRNQWCLQPFEVTDEDRRMLQEFNIDREPECCPDCRHDHRRMFSPVLTFHRRRSDLSGKPILSIFHPRNTCPVFAVDEWWSDQWDALSEGRSIDAGSPFFPQFQDLYDHVPRMANNNQNTENCEYSYSCGNAKNVYFSRTVHRSENVYYSQYVTGYNDSICDCLVCQHSSFLYKCILCFNCKSCTYLLKSSDCGDCHFSTDLIGCTDCLFCSNLRNKSFHVDNKPVAKDEYARIRAAVLTGCYRTQPQNLRRFSDVYARTTWRNLNNTGSDRCTGDILTNCFNCHQCFNCVNTRDARYCCRLTPSEQCVSSMDISSGGIGELLYNCVGLGGGNYFMRMCMNCRLCNHLTYCADCYSTKDCFGCVGLRSKQYCILNRQYAKEEYETLVPKIVEHMRNTGEWGMFFPLALSPFAYNESANREERPIPREEVLRRGWRWQEEADEAPAGTPTSKWPDDIAETDDAVTGHVFTCASSGKQYKITPQELALYRTMRIPVPREHPLIRMEKRRSIMTPYRLYDRRCGRCKKAMKTSYPPERSEKVICEECYLKEVY